MQIYFSCDFSSVIKLNGLYLGHIHPTPKHVDVSLSDQTFVEICPLIKEETPFSFILNNDFLQSPNSNAVVVDLVGGYFLHFRKSAKISGFNVLCQERFNDALITVFTENGVRVSIESASSFFAEELPCTENVQGAKIKRFCQDGIDFLLVELICTNKIVAVYKLSPEITRVYFDSVDDYVLSPNFSVKRTYKDILKHQVDLTYSFDGDKFVVNKRGVLRKKDLDLTSFRREIIPYLFLEELQVGGDISTFLSSDLKDSVNKIRTYFGDFVGIISPPCFRNFDEVGIVYKKTENKYFVKYIKFELVDKKITNFQIL